MGGEWSSPDGTAPAAGWITALEAVEGEGIYATVEWTAKAAEFIKAKEYRYMSPVIFISDDDRRAVKLASVALTNTPAMEALSLPVEESEAG